MATFTAAADPPSGVSSAYNGANQTLSWDSYVPSFDAKGNQTAMEAPNGSGVLQLTWDAENRLTQVDGPAGTTQFSYDGLGRLTGTIHANGQQDVLTWCGNRRCARRYAGGETVVRHFAEGEYRPQEVKFVPVKTTNPMVFLRYGDRWITMPDAVGSAATVLDAATSSIIAAADFTPYGEVSAGTVATDMPYAGLYRDEDTGLYFSNTRVYDPHTGRWLSRDPIGELGGINLYAYAGGDPVNRVDPDGTNPFAGAVAGAELGTVVLPGAGTVIGALVGTGLGIWAGSELGAWLAKVIDIQDWKPPFVGAPGSIVRGWKQTREYGPDGFPKTDVDTGHDHGQGDPHVHDWDRGPGGECGGENRGPGRSPGPGDPPAPSGGPQSSP